MGTSLSTTSSFVLASDMSAKRCPIDWSSFSGVSLSTSSSLESGIRRLERRGGDTTSRNSFTGSAGCASCVPGDALPIAWGRGRWLRSLLWEQMCCQPDSELEPCACCTQAILPTQSVYLGKGQFLNLGLRQVNHDKLHFEEDIQWSHPHCDVYVHWP